MFFLCRCCDPVMAGAAFKWIHLRNSGSRTFCAARWSGFLKMQDIRSSEHPPLHPSSIWSDSKRRNDSSATLHRHELNSISLWFFPPILPSSQLFPPPFLEPSAPVNVVSWTEVRLAVDIECLRSVGFLCSSC